MSNITDLEKLAELKEKGIISAKEFEEQKQAMLAGNLAQAEMLTRKSQLVYALLAFFLGCLGIHNFYAGYKGRGIAQLILSVLSIFTLFTSLFIVEIWVVIEMFVVKKDATGKDFLPSRAIAIVLGILKLLMSLLIIAVVAVGGIAGYTLAMNRFYANETLDYASKVVTEHLSYTSLNVQTCASTNVPIPENLLDVPCTVSSQGTRVFVSFTGLEPGVLRALQTINSVPVQNWENTTTLIFEFE